MSDAAISLKPGLRNTLEYMVTIGFLYQFLHLISWPGKLLGLTSPANIYVIGDETFSRYFRNFIQDQRPFLKINVMDAVSDVIPDDCHILFIGAIDRRRLPTIFASVNSQPILTVSDMTGFADIGGMIEIVRVKRQAKTYLKLRANSRLVRENNLRISTELLEIVEETALLVCH